MAGKEITQSIDVSTCTEIKSIRNRFVIEKIGLNRFSSDRDRLRGGYVASLVGVYDLLDSPQARQIRTKIAGKLTLDLAISEAKRDRFTQEEMKGIFRDAAQIYRGWRNGDR